MFRRQVWRRWVVGAVLGVCGWLSATARADRLDDELLRSGPRVMEYLRAKHYANVAVLPFRAADGRKTGRDELKDTPLEHNLADRLERALIMAIDPEHPVAVVTQARLAARQHLGTAAHDTPGQRELLFGLKYPLPLDVPDPLVLVDAFLTGKAELGADLKTTSVDIVAFDRRQPAIESSVLSFGVPTGRSILADTAEGFSLSKEWTRMSRGEPAQVAAELARLDDQAAGVGMTAGESDFPVELQILYDNRVQPLQRDAYAGPYNWLAPTPQEGQKVVFAVNNLAGDKLGIVLTVNGVNTLYQEAELEPAQMSYWTLEPHGKYSIGGFYHADGKTVSPISAISEEQSRKMVGQLGGRMAGLVELHVMRASPLAGEMPLSLIAARGQGSLRAAVVPYQQPAARPRTWEKLRQQIAAQAAGIKPRGLMAPSGDRGGQLSHEEFSCPFHTDTLVIRYWTMAQK